MIRAIKKGISTLRGEQKKSSGAGRLPPFVQLDRKLESQLVEKLVEDGALWCRDQWEVRKTAVANISLGGLVMEFGVYRGKSINFIADELPDRTIHGFDSFEGLPKGRGVWRGYFDTGHFDMGGRMPEVRENVALHKGWFEETLPEFLKSNNEENIAFLHLDCDIYESTQCVFRQVGSMIKQGTVILFDELFNYDGWQFEEYKAFMEFVKEKNVAYRFLCVGSNARRYGAFAKAAVIIDATK